MVWYGVMKNLWAGLTSCLDVTLKDKACSVVYFFDTNKCHEKTKT